MILFWVKICEKFQFVYGCRWGRRRETRLNGLSRPLQDRYEDGNSKTDAKNVDCARAAEFVFMNTSIVWV
jgi:hypothetical protein